MPAQMPYPDPARARTAHVADAVPGNWVDRLAPALARPYLRLARFDRPIGAWLLLFPCWWGQALAEVSLGRAYPNLLYLGLFYIGATVMRGAGCTWNDIVDRDFDAGVARTRSRPIPSGQVSVLQARIFMAALALAGLLVLLQFNRFTVVLAIASLGLVAIYPFMKRYTYWPQLVLGLTFKWGALVGWAAVTGGLAAPAVLLYVGCVSWTIGYDTIYAHQDKEDDQILGLKSTALRFGTWTRPLVGAFYGAALVAWAAAAWLAGAGAIFGLGLAMAAALLAWQVLTLDTEDPANCLRRFKANREVGWILFLALLAQMAMGGLPGR